MRPVPERRQGRARFQRRGFMQERGRHRLGGGGLDVFGDRLGTAHPVLQVGLRIGLRIELDHGGGSSVAEGSPTILPSPPGRDNSPLAKPAFARAEGGGRIP